MFDLSLNKDFQCGCDDGFFLVKGSKLPLWGVIPRYNIEDINLDKNNKYKQKIIFIGDITIRIGILREGYSYTYIYEKNLKSNKILESSLNIDFKGISSGKIEIIIYANEDSSIFYDLYSCEYVENIDKKTILSNFISPNINFCSEIPLYYKINGEKSFYSFENNIVKIYKEENLDLTTYFNSFSACKWKKYTTVEKIQIFFDFSGEAIVKIIHYTEDNQKLLKNILLKSEKRNILVSSPILIPTTGIIGVSINAIKNSILYGGGYKSNDKHTQNISLGIGITTYKREKYVIHAVKRLSSAIKSNELYKDKIKITVVDNGKTLSESDIPGATLIPNENLGGTGGFMRSLIYYKNSKSTTHCLFMDDDASSEPESIFRSITFLEHAKNINLAISGAMLSEKLQFMQWENGAWFDDCCHPMHCHYDMTKLDLLIKNEVEDNKYPTYGAWWFFVFPISSVKAYSFPFFVRGDDVEFSYKNDFQIARMNGISTWQEDFGLKSSPMTRYLDTRSAIILQMTLQHTDSNPLKILHLVWKFFYAPNWSYMYDSANAVVKAFSDILDGPNYWIKNIDTKDIRNYFKKTYKIEINKLLTTSYKEIQIADKNIKFKYFTKIIRRLTLNGHLCPSIFFNNDLQRLNKYQIPFINRVFFRNKILVCNEFDKTGFVLKKSSGYFFKNLIYFSKTAIYFLIKYNVLVNKYKNFNSSLVNENFWNNIFEYK